LGLRLGGQGLCIGESDWCVGPALRIGEPEVRQLPPLEALKAVNQVVCVLLDRVAAFGDRLDALVDWICGLGSLICALGEPVGSLEDRFFFVIHRVQRFVLQGLHFFRKVGM